MREQGTHHELIQKPGEDEYSYKRLCEAQALSMDTESAPQPDTDTVQEAKTDVVENEVTDLKKKGSFQGTATLVKEESTTKGEEDDENKEENEEEKQEPGCCEIWAYNKPEMPIFFFALFCSFVSGAGWPVFAFIITEMLDIFYSCSDLTGPLLYNYEASTCIPAYANETFKAGSTAHFYGRCETFNDVVYGRQTCDAIKGVLETNQTTCYAGIRTQTNWWALGLVGVAIITSTAEAVSMVIYTFMGQNLTKRLREASLKSILRQNIGWFDQKENATGALTLQLSTDAAHVESAMGARIGKMVDQSCSVVVAFTICFIFSWQLTLVMLGSSLLMIIGLSLSMIVSESLGVWIDE